MNMFQKGKLFYYMYYVIFLVTKYVYTVKPVWSNTCVLRFTDLSDVDTCYQALLLFDIWHLVFSDTKILSQYVVLDTFHCSMKLEAYLEQIARLKSV